MPERLLTRLRTVTRAPTSAEFPYFDRHGLHDADTVTVVHDAALAEQFVRDGFVKLEGVISPELAEECARDAWAAMGVDLDDRTSWPGPKGMAVVQSRAVAAAAATPWLVEVIRNLAGGAHRTGLPRPNLGLFIARFPSDQDSHDTGWHIDNSFHKDGLPWPEDPGNWGVNVHSRDRALLLLPIFTPIGAHDAPTRIRVGSHMRMAKELAPYGAAGAHGPVLGEAILRACRDDDVIVEATGEPGDVYICHPFLIHAAQLNRTGRPRLIAQPPIGLLEPYALDPSADDIAPVELAILQGIAAAG